MKREQRSRRDNHHRSKTKTLFSFVAHDGDEWSSDSDDSDYEPGVDKTLIEEKKPSTSKRWKSRSPSGGNSRSRRTTKKETATKEIVAASKPDENGHQMWAERLPSELLVMIFRTVVDDDGCIPFLCRVSRVCRKWREAASDSQLWQNVDLSNGRIKQVPRTIRFLVSHRLKRVSNLNISWWRKLKSDDFKYLFESCREIRELNVSHCILTPKSVEALSTLPSLTCLNIASSSDQVMVPCVLRNLLVNLGGRLEELTLAGNHIKGFTMVFDTLMSSCPNLRLLDFSACRYSSSQTTLDIERLQSCCPRLRVLRLHNTKLSAALAQPRTVLASPGFPELVELNLSITDRRLYVSIGLASRFTYDDDFVKRVLKNSPKLGELHVNMCIDISDESLLFIPATDLRHLAIGRCSSGRQYTGLEDILNKWKHSLETVDLSWNRYTPGSLDMGLHLLADTGRSPLHSISLVGTSVAAESIRALLEGCAHLSLVDLTSCRGLPRGVKRRYEGQTDICQLKQALGLT